jgi:protease-4
MSKFVRTFLASLLALVVVLASVGGVVAFKTSQKSKIEDSSWLHLDLYGSLPAYDPPAGITGMFSGDSQTLQSVLTSLEMAAHDDRIEGVVLQLSAALDAGYGKMEELRLGIARVREAGKPVIAYADNIDLKVTYAAAACDSFFCPRSAYITIVGLDRSLPHVRAALLKLGINPQVSAIKDYKSAAQIVSRDDMTPEARENTVWMLEEYLDIMLTGIEEGRGLDTAAMYAIMERAEMTAHRALESGLVDGILYWDELVDRCRPEEDEDPRLVSAARYMEEDPEDLGMGGDKKIAVIHAQGSIGGRRNTVNPLLGVMMGHESINDELDRALEDEDVVAIVLRVDSGGGESLASDLMGHRVEMVSREKPVVVSMVDVAASGGYSMSYRANWLMADNLTVTGSIGSITAKFDMSGFHEKIGMSFSHVSMGPNARFMDSSRPFTEDEFRMFEERHNESFMEWVTDIARARGMEVDEVDNLGQGRVWTGRQAMDNGLTDEVGGLWEAIAAARRLAEVDEDTKTALWHLPEKQGFVSSLLQGDTGAVSAAGRWLIYREIRKDYRTIRASGEPGRWHHVSPLYTD